MNGPPIVDWNYCFSSDCIVSGIYNWQTLIGGLVAIGAAWYAGKIVRAQIAAADAQETVRYNRRLNAVRSLFPLTLSGMSDYARESASCLMCIPLGLDLYGEQAVPQITPPKVPKNLIAEIGSMIEATDDANVLRMLRKMVGEVQLLNARMFGLQTELAMEPEGPHQGIRDNVDVYLLQCTVINAQCSVMFDFARFEATTVPDHLPWEDVYTAFSILGIREFAHPGLFALCERIQQRGNSAES
ncbi:hypothetical protein [Sphingobium sp. WCS2017Hpa-17]|uniref:hypothetical protein n=1 Tax=Sphingobium sp. WCS2017Hpa-17 TaxID=3073638 RepID=UPI002889939B|nr:hypothetical protein [Sphingobium sp. WCS2017Hpa-17]